MNLSDMFNSICFVWKRHKVDHILYKYEFGVAFYIHVLGYGNNKYIYKYIYIYTDMYSM